MVKGTSHSTIPAVSWMSSLCMRWSRCVSTVLMLTPSSAAICLLASQHRLTRLFGRARDTARKRPAKERRRWGHHPANHWKLAADKNTPPSGGDQPGGADIV